MSVYLNPIKRKKKHNYLLEIDLSSNDPIIEMGVAHAFKRCIFEHPSSVLNTLYVHAKPRLEVQLCNFIVREISIVSWH